MKFYDQLILLNACFLWVPLAGQNLQDSALKNESTERLIQHADTMYWMSSGLSGSMPMLNDGLESLRRAEEQLKGMQGDEGSEWRRGIESLRIELLEQREMTHDTISGVMPLAHTFLLRDGLSEWFDDPSVIATVRGANGIVDTLESYWLSIPQFDVVYSSWVKSGEEVLEWRPDTALENEMAYVLDGNARFFNRNRMEWFSVLDAEEVEAYQSEGLTSDLAVRLSEVWGLDQILGLRVKELYRDDETWFYLLSARLFDRGGDSMGVVSSFGMALDQRGKQWALVPVFVLPFLLAWALSSLVQLRQLKQCLLKQLPRCLLTALGGAALVLGVVHHIEAFLPTVDVLLLAGWWGPYVLGLVLLLLIPAVGFVATRRLRLLADWLFSSPMSARSVALGYAAGLAAVLGFAALTQYGLNRALLLVIFAVPTYSIGALIIFRTLRGNGLRPYEIWAGVGANVMSWGLILGLVPSADRSVLFHLLGGAAIAISLVSGLLAARTRLAALPLFFILLPTAFGLSLTGLWWWMLPYASLGIFYIWQSRQQGPAIIEGETTDEDRDLVRDPESILTAPETRWPFAQVPAYQDIFDVLSEMRREQLNDKVGLVTLCGEAGSGKSRILRQSLKEAKIPVVRGCCHEGDPLSFVEDTFEGARDILLKTDKSGEMGAFTALSNEVLSMVPGVSLLCDFLGGDPEEDAGSPGQIAAAILGYLEDLSARAGSPVWLWVDDAEHLSEDGALVLKELLLNALARKLPLVVLISGRTVETRQFSVANLRHNSGLKAFNLGLEWTEADLRFCLHQVLSEDCAESMVGRAGGHGIPIAAYLTWVRRLWVEGTMALQDGRLELEPAADLTDTIPNDVFDSALSVVDSLAGPHYAILQFAASAGRRFDLRILSEAIELPYRDVLEALEAAENLGIVHDHPDNDVFEFNNNIFAEALVLELRSKGGFRQRYYVIQRTLAQAYGKSKVSEHIVRAAHHAILAGKGFEREACGYVISAVTASEQSSEWNQASRYAAFILERKKIVEADAYWRAGASYLKAKWATGAFLGKGGDPLSDEAVSGLIASLEGLVSECLSEATILCACELCRILAQRGDDASLSLARRIAPEISSGEDVLPQGITGLRSLHVHGLIEYVASRHSDESRLKKARSILEQALLVDFSEDEGLLADRAEVLTSYANVLNALMKATGDRGLGEKIITSLEQSIQLKEACGDQLGLAISYGTMGRFYLYDPKAGPEDLQKAVDAFEKDLELSESLGDVTGLILMPSNIGKCLLRLGRPEEALPQYQMSLERAERLGQRLSSAFALAGMIQAMCLLNKEPGAVDSTANQLVEVLEQMSDDDRARFRGELADTVSHLKKSGDEFMSAKGLNLERYI